jgi:threonine synthase
MLDALQLLASREGIFAEPASASVVAGLKNLIEQGTISDDRVVCVITGTGLKEIHSLGGRYKLTPPVPATIEAVGLAASMERSKEAQQLLEAATL